MNNNKIWSIYKHTAPNGKGYVGYTSMKPEHRWNNGKSYKTTTYFQSAIQEFGWENFKHEILLTTRTKEMAKKAEEAMIIGCNTLWPNGYNDSLGLKRSEREKRLISLKTKGSNNGHFGKQHTEEAKRKIGEKNRGTLKGSHWYTNGVQDIQAFSCPEGFRTGRTFHK